MKIQLNTTDKIIKVEETVNLGELVEILDKILPGEWKNFKLETNTTIANWNNPIYIQPYRPYWQQPYWCTTGLQNSPLQSSGTIYNGGHGNISVLNADYNSSVTTLEQVEKHSAGTTYTLNQGIYNLEV